MPFYKVFLIFFFGSTSIGLNACKLERKNNFIIFYIVALPLYPKI